MVLKESEAVEVAEKHLKDLILGSELHLVITHIQELKDVWVFFYDSEEFITSNDITFGITGNSPFVVYKTGLNVARYKPEDHGLLDDTLVAYHPNFQD